MTTYRFEFSIDFSNKLYNFGKKHQYDNKESYKEEWIKWCIDNKNIIDNEKTMLNMTGYKGNFELKMYKSARYYFRNKNDSKKCNDILHDKNYVLVSKDFIKIIKNHIKNYFENNEENNKKPTYGYEDFCLRNREIYDNEYRRLQQIMENTDNEIIKNKIKHCYKNKYFQLIKK